jgi:hypothetical protein
LAAPAGGHVALLKHCTHPSAGSHTCAPKQRYVPLVHGSFGPPSTAAPLVAPVLATVPALAVVPVVPTTIVPVPSAVPVPAIVPDAPTAPALAKPEVAPPVAREPDVLMEPDADEPVLLAPLPPPSRPELMPPL